MITLPNFMLFVILPMLSLSILLSFVRLSLGPTVADRVIALDLLSLVAVGVIAAVAVMNNQPNLMDIAIILAVLGFLTMVAFAYYLEREKRRE
jgi:multicomponent Na+:H+ antiporter subunit F